MKRYEFLAICALSLLLTVAAGCLGTSPAFLGKVAAAEMIVPLPGNATGEVWKAPDLTIYYNHSDLEGSFEIDGEFELAQNYRAIYEKLTRAELYLLLLDSRSRVLKTVRLSARYQDETDARYPFKEKVAIPDDAVAFSFAYEGSVTETGERKPNSINFWHHPR